MATRQDSVVAPGDRRPLEHHRPDDLRERQGQHRQIDAREPNHEPAEHRRDRPARAGANTNPASMPRRQPLRRQRRGIGADAEPRRMPEARHAARPHHEMQRSREQHRDQHFRQHAERKTARRNNGATSQPPAPPTPNLQRRHRRPDQRRRLAPRRRLRPPEQPMRPQNQHHGHHREHQHQRDFRQEHDAERLQQRDQQARHIRPAMLPKPPTTTTTKASVIDIQIDLQIRRASGSASAPPIPASAAPSVNTLENSTRWSTPRAATMSRSCVAARTSVPQRVR